MFNTKIIKDDLTIILEKKEINPLNVKKIIAQINKIWEETYIKKIGNCLMGKYLA